MKSGKLMVEPHSKLSIMLGTQKAKPQVTRTRTSSDDYSIYSSAVMARIGRCRAQHIGRRRGQSLAQSPYRQSAQWRERGRRQEECRVGQGGDSQCSTRGAPYPQKK